MKKILVSVAAATMALSTTASALEDIKVSGQAKLFYETDNKVSVNGSDGVGNQRKDNGLFDRRNSAGEVTFKLGMTGKQGDVGFGATVYHSNTMGLENNVVSVTRTKAVEEDVYFGELYFTAPVAPDTVLKFGKQELDTPLAFTERWNSLPNTFNAAVAINSSIDNVTLIGAYIGQGNGNATTARVEDPADPSKPEKYVNGTWQASSDFESFYGGAYALAALYKQDTFAANFWAYYINNAIQADLRPPATGIAENVDAYAAWFDAGVKMGDANVKGYLAYMDHTGSSELAKAIGKTGDGVNGDATFAAALSADMKISDITLFGAASYVSEGDLPVANTATGYKKTMLPTQGIYADGLFVAQPGSTAVKVSAATKLGDTALSLNAVHNMNSGAENERMGILGTRAQELEMTEVYATVKQKLGAFDLMGIVMHHEYDDSKTDKTKGGQTVRIVASVNF